MTGQLHGKVALVTGGGTGIGRATALALGEAGASVLVHYSRSQEDAHLVVKLIEDLGCQAHAVQADFANRSSVKELAEAAEGHWGHVDILINNAGWMSPGIDPKTQGGDFGSHIEHWDRHFDVNVRAPYELTWRIAKGMQARGNGCVVNVASVAGMYAMTDAPLYSLTKAALLHFTRQAAQMYAPKIRVNAVAPGWIHTGFGGGFIEEPEFQKQVSKHIPYRRVGDVDEVAGAILWLCSGASYMTGTTLTVDGGMVSELR